jgi:hypothetical protein
MPPPEFHDVPPKASAMTPAFSASIVDTPPLQVMLIAHPARIVPCRLPAASEYSGTGHSIQDRKRA